MAGATYLLGPDMVYDLFPYNGERQILEIRLNELADVVDLFFICQSKQTISGKDRIIHPVKEQFPQFAKQIVQVEAPTCEIHSSLWEREWAHRNYCKQQLPTMDNYTFLVYGDVDEIPKASKLEQAKEIAFERGYCSLQMPAYYYYLNVFHGDWPDWSFPVLYHGPIANLMPANQIRHNHINQQGRLKDGQPSIRSAGWHFTYQGGRREVIRKLNSFAHANDSSVPSMVADYESGTEPMDRDARGGIKLTTVPVDETFPQYVRDNFNALAAQGFIKL